VKRTIVLAAAVAALFSVAPGVAQAAPVDDKQLCKDGGFAKYVDPTTDLPFKNQGRCVSFVNGGGTLVPVQDEPPVPLAPTAKLSVGEYLDGTFPVTVEAQGSPNTAYQLTVGGEVRAVTTSVDGLATFTVNVAPETTFEVRHGGQVLGSVTTPAAPVQAPSLSTEMAAAYDPVFRSVRTTLKLSGDDGTYPAIVNLGGITWSFNPVVTNGRGTINLGGLPLHPGSTFTVEINGQVERFTLDRLYLTGPVKSTRSLGTTTPTCDTQVPLIGNPNVNNYDIAAVDASGALIYRATYGTFGRPFTVSYGSMPNGSTFSLIVDGAPMGPFTVTC
jgi:hypothetical protein